MQKLLPVNTNVFKHFKFSIFVRILMNSGVIPLAIFISVLYLINSNESALESFQIFY